MSRVKTSSKSKSQPRVRVRCAYCHDELPREGRKLCRSCMAPHHAECWEEHGLCSVAGCEELEAFGPEVASPRTKTRKRRRPSRQNAQLESKATTAMVLGLVSLLACGLVGPFAIMEANAVTRLARKARQPVPGSATAGLVMGWIGTIGVCLGIVVFALQLSMFAAL